VGKATGLALALAFVFATAFVPHLDTFGEREGLDEDDPGLVTLAEASWQYWVTGEREGYPYSTHVDENVHWVRATGIQHSDGVFVSYPTGEPTEQEGLFSLRGAVHERGFHLVLAEAQELTGVSWQTIFHYGPAAWWAFVAFGVWAMLRPHPAAIPAAAFVGLTPTTVRFLGPGFLVPVTFSLAWMPATQMLSGPAQKRGGAAALLGLTAAWAFFVHLIGGWAALGLLLVAGLLGTAAQRRRSLVLVALGALPGVWLYRTFEADVQTEIERIGDLPVDFTVFDNFGLWALGLWAGGLLLMALWPPRDEGVDEGTVHTWAGFSMAALGLIVATVALFDTRYYATYDRWHPPFFLAASVPAGYAVARLAALARRTADGMLPDVHARGHAAAAVALVAGLALAGTALSSGADDHVEEPYYRVMDDETWERYRYVQANVGDEHEVFLAHPWQAPVLAGLSGKTPHTYLQPGSPPIQGEDYRSFARDGGSLELFVSNDITLVVADGKPPFDAFETEREGVHAMKEDVATQIAEIRAAERNGR
jgi:hypothetical protein